MIKLSVIIPYFQRESGILRRAVNSVLAQKLIPGIEVEVIIVDDGSPVPAKVELQGAIFQPPFSLSLIEQKNAGVAAARNAGLKHIKNGIQYIAFLDSDDSWHENHLITGVHALESGYDFYFCDNRRAGHHESYFASCSSLLTPFIAKAVPGSIIELNRDDLSAMILKEFVAQASTVIYRREAAGDLLFDEQAKNAGEDIIFLITLISRVKRIGCMPKVLVECGSGINMYFANLSWDSPGHLKCVIDSLRAHAAIRKQVSLPPKAYAINNARIAGLKRNIAFLTLRHMVKNTGAVPPEVKDLAKKDKGFAGWFAISALQAVGGKAFGLYRPE